MNLIVFVNVFNINLKQYHLNKDIYSDNKNNEFKKRKRNILFFHKQTNFKKHGYKTKLKFPQNHRYLRLSNLNKL